LYFRNISQDTLSGNRTLAESGNPTKILADIEFGKTAGFWPEPNSGTAPTTTKFQISSIFPPENVAHLTS